MLMVTVYSFKVKLTSTF